MIPVLFDTNIYGKIVDDARTDKVMEKIGLSHFRVLDFSLIRQELRQTGKQTTLRRKKKLRPVLLTTYDQIVSGETIAVSKDIIRLADDYYARYKRLGGSVGKKRVLNDFRILACATLRRCEIVVSDDSHLMRGSKLLKACRAVNLQRGLRTAGLIGYRELKQIVNAW